MKRSVFVVIFCHLFCVALSAQNLIVNKTTRKLPQPLIVDVSGDREHCAQPAFADKEILARNWNYVRLNISRTTIDDAIQHALKNSNTNPREVHVVGVSKGGQAVLQTYMNVEYPVKSFSVWLPAIDLEQKYWDLPTYVQPKCPDTKLFVYASFHKDSTGLGRTASQEAVTLNLSRVDSKKNGKKLFSHDIYLSRKYKNVQFTVFEGRDIPLPQIWGLLPVSQKVKERYNILLIGDSNGQKRDGWANQLKKMMPDSHILNFSESGRSIGFDNQNKERLNALKNIEHYLDDAEKAIGEKRCDYIVVCLGTNDTKSAFARCQAEVAGNLERLLDKIRRHPLCERSKPVLIYVTPPPVKKMNTGKFAGADKRLSALLPGFKSASVKNGFIFVDVYHPLSGILDYYARDGVHMHGAGQAIIASEILHAIVGNK